MLNRTNIVLSGLFILVVAAAGMVRVDLSKPNFEILPEMKYTPAWTTYAANPNFPNGRTLQAPVTGTIARGELPLHFAATKEDAIRAGAEIRNPYGSDALAADPPGADGSPPDDTRTEAVSDKHAQTPTRKDGGSTQSTPSAEDIRKKKEAEAQQRLQASVVRGRDVFRIFCICCHGPNGAGDGPVTRRGFPPPPSLLTGKSREMKDGQLFHVLSYGQGSMASMSAPLTRPQRWDVINFIRDMQRKAPAPATKAAGSEKAPAGKG